jgi:hypothetical protein
LELKHAFEKNTRRAWGKNVTFSALRFWRRGLEEVKPPENPSNTSVSAGID